MCRSATGCSKASSCTICRASGVPCEGVLVCLVKATFLWSDPCREVGSNSEASPSRFYSASASQSNLHNLGQMSIVSANRGLNIHDMAMEQSNGQTTYDDSQKKAKLEVNMGFASSNSSGAAAEGAGETFTSQAETQAHGSGSAANWQQQQSHPPHHAHPQQQQQQAYASPPQYPSGYFSQVGKIYLVSMKLGLV